MRVRRLQAVVPFPGVARQVLGAEPVVGAVEPGLHVGKQDMDDRHEPLGVLAFALGDGVVPIGAREVRRARKAGEQGPQPRQCEPEPVGDGR